MEFSMQKWQKWQKIGIQLLGVMLIIALVQGEFFRTRTATEESASGLENQCDDHSNSASLNARAYASSEVIFAGYNWDTIGYNNDEEVGISGPKNTVTLLLDTSSHHLVEDYSRFEDAGKHLDEMEARLTPDEAQRIVKHPTTKHAFWLLDLKDASALKETVRAYDSAWWLNSASGHRMLPNGEVDFRAVEVGEKNALRPAIFLRTDAFIKDAAKIHADTTNVMEHLVVGACSRTKQVNLAGYVWDIISYNDGVQHGLISTPKSSAVFLLSGESASKFMNGAQMEFGADNNYKTSAVHSLSGEFYQAFSKLEPEIEVLPRAFGASPITDDGSIAGQNVTDAYFWALSLEEANKLENHERVYPYSWWLRSPGVNNSYTTQILNNGLVDKAGWMSKYTNAFRPAFSAKLTPKLKNAIDNAVDNVGL
jgi:hypothetical protein